MLRGFRLTKLMSFLTKGVTGSVMEPCIITLQEYVAVPKLASRQNNVTFHDTF